MAQYILEKISPEVAGGVVDVDMAVRGALVSVTDEQDGAGGAEDRGGRGGRGRPPVQDGAGQGPGVSVAGEPHPAIDCVLAVEEATAQTTSQDTEGRTVQDLPLMVRKTTMTTKMKITLTKRMKNLAMASI